MSDVSDHVATLLRLLADTNGKISDVATGACLYFDPAGTPHCANLTEAQCAVLGGRWDPDTRCVSDDPAGPGQCKAQ